jgi:membrane-bound lytic murein transglycosylase B
MPRQWVRLAVLTSLLLPGAATVHAGYADRPEVRAFVLEMADRYAFPPAQLLALFAGARQEPSVLRLITPPRDPRMRSWRSYRQRFVDPVRIAQGLQFWRAHQATLAEAQARFGVPPELVVAIIGVETIYGRDTGNFQTLSALATLAFDYPPRAQAFRAELEQLLLLAREKRRPATDFHGSYAGALGLPQFMPSSYRRYAVDFDGDGAAELTSSPADAIGSVAHFLKQHGWREGGEVAQPVSVPAEARWLADGGVLPRHLPAELAAHGVLLPAGIEADQRTVLIDLVTPDGPTEYWLGYDNFYVLTRYNRSSFYAMAVHQLAQALRQARAMAAASE